MKWILFFFLLVLGFASLLLWYLQDPGYIEVIWLGYEIHLSVFVAFFLLLFVVLSFLLSKHVLTRITELPFLYFSFLRKSREKKAKDEMMQLLTSLEAEDFSGALSHQKKAALILGLDPLFLWFSGTAFVRANKPLEAEKCYIELTKNPLTTFLGLKGQIRSALHRGDYKLAYTLLNNAEKLVPTSPWVLKHFLAIASEQKNFKKAEELILRLEDLDYFPSEKSKKQIALLQYLDAIQIETSPSQKETLLRQSHRLDPSLAEATESLANLLSEKGNKKEALYTIETTWRLTPIRSLGNLYVKIFQPKDDLEAYQAATELVKEKSKSSENLFFLAEMALKAKLWGEARNHIKELVKLDPRAKVYELLAALELEENQNSNAALSWLYKGFQGN
jgi:HemY protein